MSQRLISLRLSERCTTCSREIPVWMEAWYDPEAKSVTCVDCQDASAKAMAQRSAAASSPPPPIDIGLAGGDPARREARTARTWGRLAPVIPFVRVESQAPAHGERRLSAYLEVELGDGDAIVLHSQPILVIAPSGVWVVDAKDYSGKVERRDVGNWRKVDHRLFVNNRDRTKLVDAMKRHVTSIRKTLLSAGFDNVRVHPTLLFTNSEWPWFARPLEIRGVQVMWANKLCELAGQPGPLGRTEIEAVAARLDPRLPRVVTS